MGVIAMLTSIFVLFALPWLDTSPVRSGRFRPLFKVFYWVLVAVCVLLTYAGGQPPEGTWLIMSRIGAAYHFAHFFLVLPLLARVAPDQHQSTCSISDRSCCALRSVR